MELVRVAFGEQDPAFGNRWDTSHPANLPGSRHNYRRSIIHLLLSFCIPPPKKKKRWGGRGRVGKCFPVPFLSKKGVKPRGPTSITCTGVACCRQTPIWRGRGPPGAPCAGLWTPAMRGLPWPQSGGTARVAIGSPLAGHWGGRLRQDHCMLSGIRKQGGLRKLPAPNKTPVP